MHAAGVQLWLGAVAVHVSLGHAGCVSVLRALADNSGHWRVLPRLHALDIDLVRAARQASTL